MYYTVNEIIESSLQQTECAVEKRKIQDCQADMISYAKTEITHCFIFFVMKKKRSFFLTLTQDYLLSTVQLGH